MYTRFKTYLIGEALKNAKTIFDAMKLELMFQLIALYVVIYVLGSIPIFIGGYTTIMVVQILGLVFILAMAISLKRTKSIKFARIIWFVSGLFFTFSSAILNSGQASFITFSFSMVNIVISFLVLGRFLRRIAIGYYLTFITLALSISLGLLPRLELPIDLSREHEFFNQPNVYAILIALTMTTFIVHQFIRTHYIAAKQVLDKKEQVILQKDLIEKKNVTIRESIGLAAKMQKSRSRYLEDLEVHFSDQFHYHMPSGSLSGEFFWVYNKGNSIILALVDSKKLDIAGAMYSYFVRNALTKAMKTSAQSSLKSITEFVNVSLQQHALGNETLNSGINFSLCEYNSKTNILELVALNQPIIIESNGAIEVLQPNTGNLSDLSKSNDIQSVKLELSSKDTLYMVSDGISDGNRPTYENFTSVLKSCSTEYFENKKSIISKIYEFKKQDKSQIDDITIIGLRI